MGLTVDILSVRGNAHTLHLPMGLFGLGIDDIAVHRFSEHDVVRHRLVQKIILAYENYDKAKQKYKIRKDNEQ